MEKGKRARSPNWEGWFINWSKFQLAEWNAKTIYSLWESWHKSNNDQRQLGSMEREITAKLHRKDGKKDKEWGGEVLGSTYQVEEISSNYILRHMSLSVSEKQPKKEKVTMSLLLWGRGLTGTLLKYHLQCYIGTYLGPDHFYPTCSDMEVGGFFYWGTYVKRLRFCWINKI